MFKIGDFSRLTRISIRMLRYYDEHAILKPRKIDEESGYRYYDVDQIFLACQINILAQMDFSTALIKKIVDKFPDKEEVVLLLSIQEEVLRKEEANLSRKIQCLERAIQMINKEAVNMKYEVKVKDFDKKYMMCTRDIIPSYDKEHLLWKRICSEIQEKGMHINYAKPAHSRAYFYSEGYQEKDPDVEVCIEVQGTYEDSDHITFKWVPAVKAASITFKGGYHQTLEVSLALAAWINEHNYELNGPDFSIYHIGPGVTEDENEYITEVCFPIKAK